jgi:two-component system NtrC family sensor kinase
VFISLPIRTPAAIMEDSSTQGPAVEEIEGSYYILVVDDEEPVLRLMERLLSDLGHRVRVATSGEQALELIAHDNFDVVLADVKMPGMSGFELATAIRRHEPELAERIIFLTGDTLSHITRDQLEQSGNLFLSKPFSIDDLAEMLQSLLRRRSIGSNGR